MEVPPSAAATLSLARPPEQRAAAYPLRLTAGAAGTEAAAAVAAAAAAAWHMPVDAPMPGAVVVDPSGADRRAVGRQAEAPQAEGPKAEAAEVPFQPAAAPCPSLASRDVLVGPCLAAGRPRVVHCQPAWLQTPRAASPAWAGPWTSDAGRGGTELPRRHAASRAWEVPWGAPTVDAASPDPSQWAEGKAQWAAGRRVAG